jgi:hypothetical protein
MPPNWASPVTVRPDLCRAIDLDGSLAAAVGAGDDVIDTLGGDDWIVATGGSDTVSGGDGHDTYVAHLATAITIDSAADEKFGGYTGSAGDVDGDGLGDMLIGGGETDVYLVTGAALNDGDLIGADAAVDIDDLLGQHGTVKLVADGLVDYGAGNTGPNYTNYAALGDIDGDGKGDFLIGAPASDVDGVTDAGTAWLVTSTFLDSYDAGSDNSIDLDDALTAKAAGLYAIRDSDPAANGTGAMLAAADLIGSDGASDLVIGSPGSATNDSPFDTGVTRVIDGAGLLALANSDGVIDLASLDPDDADAMVTLRGTFLFPAANAIAPISDFSGDERAELGLSAPFANFQGRNYVITSQALEEARGTDIVIDANFRRRRSGLLRVLFVRRCNIGTATSPGRAMWMGTRWVTCWSSGTFCFHCYRAFRILSAARPWAETRAALSMCKQLVDDDEAENAWKIKGIGDGAGWVQDGGSRPGRPWRCRWRRQRRVRRDIAAYSQKTAPAC